MPYLWTDQAPNQPLPKRKKPRKDARRSTNIEDRRNFTAADEERLRLEESERRREALKKDLKKAQGAGLPQEMVSAWIKDWTQQNMNPQEQEPALPSGSPTGFWGGEIPDRRDAFLRRASFNPTLAVQGGAGAKDGLLEMIAQERLQQQPMPAQPPQTPGFAQSLGVPQQQLPAGVNMGQIPMGVQQQLLLLKKMREQALRDAILQGAQTPQFNIPAPRLR